jgi:hypothetical protein
LLAIITLNSPQDLTLGVQVKNLTIGTGGGKVAFPDARVAEVTENYSILAVANPTIAGMESTTEFLEYITLQQATCLSMAEAQSTAMT